jgi:hypothetical protein
MDIIAIVFGDEGKGLGLDYLLYNGQPNGIEVDRF